MMQFLRNIDIELALSKSDREYLVGQLSRPQRLEHIVDERVEIGITDYSSRAVEKPHTHSIANEYQLMLSGQTKYLDIDTNEEYSFTKGDFYIIRQGTRYAQKSEAGTRILFLKVPPGNDKITIEMDEQVNKWLGGSLETVRKEHFYSANAPTFSANSMKPAVAVAVYNKRDKCILMLESKGSGKWTMPGGVLKHGESLLEAARRGIKEETNIDISELSLVGTYSSPDLFIDYGDNEINQELTLLYLAQIDSIESDNVVTDSESKGCSWMSIDEALSLHMAVSQKRRIQDFKEYIVDGIVKLR